MSSNPIYTKSQLLSQLADKRNDQEGDTIDLNSIASINFFFFLSLVKYAIFGGKLQGTQ